MKKAILLLTALALPAHGHDWNADAWADQQLQLLDDTMKCVQYKKFTPKRFEKECDVPKLFHRAFISFGIIADEVRIHGDDSRIDFSIKDFGNPARGISALYSLEVLKEIRDILEPELPAGKPRVKSIPRKKHEPQRYMPLKMIG